MQEGRNWAQLLYTCSKIHHLHGELGQGEVWITSWLFHFAGWGSFSCFSSRLPRGQSRCQPRGIFSSSPEAEWSPWVLAKDFTSAHSSAHCWGLWLTLVPGSMRCPVEEELCSRQCSFKPSRLTPHPGPRYEQAVPWMVGHMAAPAALPGTLSYHTSPKDKGLFMTNTTFPGCRMSSTVLLLVIECSHAHSSDSCKLD